MLPKIHAFFAAILSILIFFIFNISYFQTIIIFLSSILIDFDHYLWFVINKKSYNLKKAFNWFSNKREFFYKYSSKKFQKYKKSVLIFHGIEFLIPLFLLAYFYDIFLFVLIGVIFHLILDYVEIIYLKEPLYTKFSQLVVYYKNKDKSEIELTI